MKDAEKIGGGSGSKPGLLVPDVTAFPLCCYPNQAPSPDTSRSVVVPCDGSRPESLALRKMKSVKAGEERKER